MSNPPVGDDIEDRVFRARGEGLRPLPWPGSAAAATRSQELLPGGAVRYRYGSFFVDVEEDGRVVVNLDDWLSKLALAIEGTADVRGKFLRLVDGRTVPIEDDDLIYTGETLLHVATAERHRLNRRLGDRSVMVGRFPKADPMDRAEQLLKMQTQMRMKPLLGAAIPLFPTVAARDREAARMLVDYAKRRLERVDRLGEEEKQGCFLSDTQATIAILLYEFATGKGRQYRQFDPKHAITASLISSPITSEILKSFALANAWETDINRLVGTPSGKFEGVAFSPDQTPSVIESLEKHAAAFRDIADGNDLRLFFGGVSYRVDVDAANGALRILVRDAKTAYSLFLHSIESRERLLLEETPLGTTNQDYTFSVPVPWDLIHLSESAPGPGADPSGSRK